jgi:DNA-binding NarL/FixJ family response regulator
MSSVAIVDDHRLFAEALRLALGQSGVEARVVAPAAPSQVVADLVTESPELVLLDLDLGAWGDSTPLIAPLVAAGLRVLVVTGTSDRMRIAAALEQGAIGYQLKEPGLQPLLLRISRALSARGALDAEHRVVLLDELVRTRAATAAARAPFELLTEREAQTLRELVRGHSVATIAAGWYVSEATVRSHVRSILGKLAVPSQLAAVAAAVETGWAGPT